MTTTDGPRIAIAMRSYNDIDVIRGTLEAIRDQNFRDYQLWNFDSTSSDGTIDVIREFNDADHIDQNDPKSYNPGTVMNDAVKRIAAGQPSAEIIVFINSDATPETPDWLERMIAPFEHPEVAASFGRQTARPDCRSLFRKDTERAFGDGSESAKWVHFFSMANSAVRRSVIEAIPFETQVQYSEDIEWSYRLKQAGHKIEYVADAPATHSHNYTLKQSYKRMYGEGKAEAWIFRRGEMKPSLLRYFLLPFGMEVLRDIVWGIRTLSLDALLHTVPLRFVQKWGRWQGFKDGRVFYGID
ncbi:MAG: glycosyltransferase family 2 protein [Gammaproteobacteria bacterium]|nr:glycosyltransferase family 2 protein [Gammaproteobacteria bacterium]MCP5136663.1 glycosyltransferase family 2 protein [Gammaproteobacteria bacterium]